MEEIKNKVVETSKKVVNSASYKENSEKIANSLSKFSFSKLNVDKLTGKNVNLSAEISNAGELFISDYGVLLAEISGDSSHADRKGSTTLKSLK